MSKYSSEIPNRIAKSPKEKWVVQLERIEKFEILKNFADDLKVVPRILRFPWKNNIKMKCKNIV